MARPGIGLVGACLMVLACRREDPAPTREPIIETASPVPVTPSAAPLSSEEVRLRKRADLARQLEPITNVADAIELLRPEMGDQEVGFRPILSPGAARRLLAEWGRKHFHWQELSQGKSVDVAAVLRDVEPHRGERVCLNGTFEDLEPLVFLDKRDGVIYRHQVSITNVREQAPAGECTVCGVLVGRTIDLKEDNVDDVGLVVVGLVNPDDGKAPRR